MANIPRSSQLVAGGQLKAFKSANKPGKVSPN
jgi:hypothetical protein